VRVGRGARERGKRGVAVERGQVCADEAGRAARRLVELGGGLVRVRVRVRVRVS